MAVLHEMVLKKECHQKPECAFHPNGRDDVGFAVCLYVDHRILDKLPLSCTAVLPLLLLVPYPYIIDADHAGLGCQGLHALGQRDVADLLFLGPVDIIGAYHIRDHGIPLLIGCVCDIRIGDAAGKSPDIEGHCRIGVEPIGAEDGGCGIREGRGYASAYALCMVCYRAMMEKLPLTPMHHPIEDVHAVPIAHHGHQYEEQLLK